MGSTQHAYQGHIIYIDLINGHSAFPQEYLKQRRRDKKSIAQLQTAKSLDFQANACMVNYIPLPFEELCSHAPISQLAFHQNFPGIRDAFVK